MNLERIKRKTRFVNLGKLEYQIKLEEKRSSAVIKNLEGQKFFYNQYKNFRDMLDAVLNNTAIILPYSKDELEAKIDHYERCLHRVRSWMPLAEQLYIVEYWNEKDNCPDKKIKVIRALDINDAVDIAIEISKEDFKNCFEHEYDLYDRDDVEKLDDDADRYYDYSVRKFSMRWLEKEGVEVDEECEFYQNEFMHITNKYQGCY